MRDREGEDADEEVVKGRERNYHDDKAKEERDHHDDNREGITNNDIV